MLASYWLFVEFNMQQYCAPSLLPEMEQSVNNVELATAVRRTNETDVESKEEMKFFHVRKRL
jgi:hypothetical protein